MSVPVDSIASCLVTTSRLIARMLVFALRCYQVAISPFLGNRCRFYPSCSNYALFCLKSYPITTALVKTSWRLCKCHPAHPGGIDLP